MLIIAIPKSASTSLMHTLKRLHNIDSIQDTTFNNNQITATNYLSSLHSDIREITANEVKKFSEDTRIYKQHVFPSDHNIMILKEVKKVVLLRDPKDIIKAYRRGVLSKIHVLFDGYSYDMDENQWIEQSKKNGLYDDLVEFYDKWMITSGDSNSLIITYEDLINAPNEVINKVEKFWDLQITDSKITLSKKRYSRRNRSSNFVHILTEKIVKSIKNILYRIKVLLLYPFNK